MFSSLRKLILVVLGIPFVILGTRFLLDTGQTTLIHWSASSWTTGNAILLAADQFSSADQALGNQTVVRYRYEFDGQSHDGQYSCIGDECPQADLHLVLQSVQAENRTMAVLIDPDRPERSLLYRHLHMPLFLLKAGAGLFCFFTGSVAVVFGVYLLCGPGPARRKE
jgi:hypothetical protein